MKVESVPRWIRQRAKRDGAPTSRVTEIRESDGTVLADRTPAVAYRMMTRSVQTVLLEFRDRSTGSVDRIGVRETGVLGWLKQLSEDLARQFDIVEECAVDLVLCGVPPPMRLAVATAHHRWPFPALSKVRIEADPRLAPRGIMDLYSRTRRTLLADISGGERSRPMTEGNAEYAVFAAEHPASKWKSLMKAWNEAHPDRRAVDERRFSRDVREAWFRVTGERFNLGDD
jgi:hypothetical protein